MKELDSLLSKIKINKEEFLFQFQSHPNFPSALALSDTLNFLDIYNSAYELDKKYWSEIPNDFITLYNQNFALIKKDTTNNRYHIYSDEKKIVDENELKNNSSDLVILLNDTDRDPYQTTSYNLDFLLAIFAFIIIILYSSSLTIFLFNFLSLVGVYLSYEIFKEKFGNTSVVLNTICGKVNTNTACNKIISSDKTNILGLKISDISLIYFSGLLIIGIIEGSYPSILFMIPFCASIIIFYSLYIQIFVEKKICKVCMAIIAILILQLILSILSINTINYEFQNTPAILFIYFITFYSFYIHNQLVTKNKKLQKDNIKNLKFKRSYDLFKSQLLSNNQIQINSIYQSFFIGNPQSKIHISLISNPFCGFCKSAHEIIEELLKKYANNISVQIRFNYISEQNDENIRIVISYFKNIYTRLGEEIFLQEVEKWFRNRDLESIKKENITTDLSEEAYIGHENIKWGFNFTPLILINGYIFPKNYEREDIFYFIDELLEDEEIINLSPTKTL